MKSNFLKKVIGAALAGVMAVSLIPAATFTASAATSNSTVISYGSNGIYNASLYQAVLSRYDANKDGKLTVGEANQVTELNIVGQGKLTSLKGIYWLPNLKSLTIQNCGLSSVHSDIGKLTKLENLNLSYNKITKLPTAVGSLKNLISVDLSGNKLTALPTNAKYWKKLTSLDLSNNAFKQVSTGSMPYMKALTTLDLSNNQMANNTSTLVKKLDALKTLTKLTTLDLSDNSLTAFPTNTVAAMTKLTTLDLSGNKLTSIPSTIGKLTKLKVLDASNNKISSLSSSISKCTSLTKLNLANNQLSKIPSLKALTKLKCTGTDYYALNLCGNKLSQTTIRSNTNTVLNSAWVKRQTTKTFVPIEKIEAQPVFAIAGYTTDLANSYTINPSNATYKTVKFAVDNVSEGITAKLDGTKLTVTKNSADTTGYVFVKVISLDGSNTQSLIYISIL